MICSALEGEEAGRDEAATTTAAVESDVTIEDVTGNAEEQVGLEETAPLQAIEPDGPPTRVNERKCLIGS